MSESMTTILLPKAVIPTANSLDKWNPALTSQSSAATLLSIILCHWGRSKLTLSLGPFASFGNEVDRSTQASKNESLGKTLAGMENWREKSVADQLKRLHHGSPPTSTKIQEGDAEPVSPNFTNEPLTDSLLELPPRPVRDQRHSSPYLHPLQEWEGYVLGVGPESFTARLLDLTAGSTHEEEEAEIPIQEISERDRPRIQSGAIFAGSSATNVPLQGCASAFR